MNRVCAAFRIALPRCVRCYIVPSRAKNVINVYRPQARRIPEGKSALDVVNETLYAKYDPTGEKRALLDKTKPTCPRAGDILRITKTDKSSFIGMLLALNRNGLGTTMLLRTKINGIGVENRFKIFNPQVASIEVLRVPALRWPKQKYYFVRSAKKYDAGDLDAYMRRQRRR